MRLRPIGTAAVALALGAAALAAAEQRAQPELKEVIGASLVGNEAAQAAQAIVERLSDDADALAAEYRRTLHEIQSLQVYEKQLDELLASQEKEIGSLQRQIDEAALVARQIMPLMLRMIDSLESFVQLDVPFLSEERRQRVRGLRELMPRADVSLSEKYRRLLEAYQVENEYGRTIEAYRGTIASPSGPRTVDFLRVGRVALLYQTLDGSETGFWQKSERNWVVLPASYRGAVRRPADRTQAGGAGPDSHPGARAGGGYSAMTVFRLPAFLILTLVVLTTPAPARDAAAPAAPATLAELLERIRAGNAAEELENQQREAAFRRAKEHQQRLLSEALALKAETERRVQTLETRFGDNEKRIPEMEETLRRRLGTLGELFGVARQVAGDTAAQIAGSLISAQLPGRSTAMSQLAQKREMPAIEDLERLWFTLQQEMTESGRIVRFPATVITVEGGETRKNVVRIGAFNAVAGGRYLQYVPESGKLTELGRQPAASHLATIRTLEDTRGGVVGVSIDPSRGSLLSLLIETPDLRERVDQGGLVGYTIIALGLFGFLLAAYRLLSLFLLARRIRAQMHDPKTQLDNPLGRILAVAEQHHAADVETLELKLDEAILKETPALERGIAMIKVLSVVAPLLGLLGTVTGMIKTFQVITLFGAGDPKLMAGGIAEALVTTMLGLIVAVPLTLLHVLVSGQSRRLVQVLDEQSAGIVAERAEALEGGRAQSHAFAG